MNNLEVSKTSVNVNNKEFEEAEALNDKIEKQQKERTVNYNKIFLETFTERTEEEEVFNDYETRKLFGILELDFRDERCSKFLKEIIAKKIPLPDLRLLSLRYIEEDDEDLKTVMTNIVVKVQSLFFNNHAKTKYRIKKIDIGNYIEDVINILPKVTKDVYFYYMKINGRQLSSIIKNSSHVTRIGFIKCKISITSSSLDFSKPIYKDEDKYSIKSLNFKGCGDGVRGGIMTEDDFQKIIKAISESGLRDSLTKLRTSMMNIEEEFIKGMMEEYDLENIELIQVIKK
ncbi:unnamed protein product [Moneuplotes crassus]|uniref:Uncharacterized protein n=1 Tax=Euplotes crassus TaxID=5936 RepID=A0AAD2D025_EUPCR|nr:unnamed protein product [Moneuplotes crassus]